MDIKEIQSLIKFVAKSGASEVKLEMEDVKITIKTGSETPETTFIQAAAPMGVAPQMVAQAPVAQAATPQAAAPSNDASSTEDDSKYITIKSPIIGTFYRKPSPDKPLFVEVGQNIAEGDVLCIIEAMKVFNQIPAEKAGKIVEILVENGDAVEFGQPLFRIEPV